VSADGLHESKDFTHVIVVYLFCFVAHSKSRDGVFLVVVARLKC
jgi:hypothetical protein